MYVCSVRIWFYIFDKNSISKYAFEFVNFTKCFEFIQNSFQTFLYSIKYFSVKETVPCEQNFLSPKSNLVETYHE